MYTVQRIKYNIFKSLSVELTTTTPDNQRYIISALFASTTRYQIFQKWIINSPLHSNYAN